MQITKVVKKYNKTATVSTFRKIFHFDIIIHRHFSMTSLHSDNLTSQRENVSDVLPFVKQVGAQPGANDITLGKNNIMKKTRNALGDIGNHRTGDGNPIPGFKEPMMKSFKATAGKFQQTSQGVSKPTAEQTRATARRLQTTVTGVTSTAAFRQPTKGTATGRSFRVLPTSNANSNSVVLASQQSLQGTTLCQAERPLEATESQNVPIPQIPGKLRPGTWTARGEPEVTIVEKEVATVVAAFSEQRLNDEVEDIDAKDVNHVLVTEYVNDIMAYMFELEKKYPIEPRYLDARLINSRMRAVLMDWLVDVHSQYSFTPETLFLCNKLLDRFLLADRTVTRADLQLVGVTSLYLAAKYEEVYTPAMRDFAVICDNAFTVSDIRQMENRMLSTLQFDLACPQPCFYLRRFSKAAKADVKLHTLSKYIMELSVVDYNVIDMLPSAVAAGSLALATMILENKPLHLVWTPTLQHYSTYSFTNVRPHALRLAHVLARVHEESSKLKAIKTKYSKGKALLRISRSEELNVEKWKKRVLAELEDD